MKKHLLTLSFIILAGAVAFSQSLSLSWDEQPINDGDTLYVLGEIPYGEWYEMEVHAVLTNNTANEINAKVKSIEIEIVEGADTYMCWDACYPPDITEPGRPIVLGPGESTGPLAFSGHYIPNENLGTSIIQYIFFYEEDPNDSISMTVYFIGSLTSVSEQRFANNISNAYPNPAQNQVSFDYDFSPNVKSAQIRIFNTLGKQVLEVPVNHRFGRIDIPLNDLGEGVYFYSLVINGETSTTRKLIIRR